MLLHFLPLQVTHWTPSSVGLKITESRKVLSKVNEAIKVLVQLNLHPPQTLKPRWNEALQGLLRRNPGKKTSREQTESTWEPVKVRQEEREFTDCSTDGPGNGPACCRRVLYSPVVSCSLHSGNTAHW